MIAEYRDAMLAVQQSETERETRGTRGARLKIFTHTGWRSSSSILIHVSS
jgi:hypothetical protein